MALTVDVVNIRTLVACKKNLDKQIRLLHRSRSDCLWSSLIRVFLVYNSSKNFVNSSLDNQHTGPRSAVSNVSGNRCEPDCRSRGCKFDPGPVPYFLGDWSWNNFYGHSPPFRWWIQEGLLSVTSEGMCTKYWLIACPGKSVVRWTDHPTMTIAVDLGRRTTKQTKITNILIQIRTRIDRNFRAFTVIVYNS